MFKFSLLISTLFYGIILQASIVVTSGLKHVYHANGGDQIQDVIIIQNLGKSPQKVSVYLNDVEFYCPQQDNQFVEPNSHYYSASGWANILTPEYTIPPGSEINIPYSFIVPQHIQSGSFWSIIMVEVSASQAQATRAEGVKIKNAIRYAVACIFQIGDQSSETFELQAVELDLPKGVAYISIENLGDQIAFIEFEVQLLGLESNKEVMVQTKQHVVYPKSCKKIQIPLPELSKGRYTGLLVASTNQVYKGVELSIEQ